LEIVEEIKNIIHQGSIHQSKTNFLESKREEISKINRVWNILFEKCPSCHKRFQRKEIKRGLLGSDDNSKADPNSVLGLERYSLPENYQSPHVHTYKITYKCKSCGHEWNDLIQTKA
jgi:ssDNA-binding Zn-finger/Zn-ribbon topoisomerase 1